jgi:hypothetical protein
MPIQGLPSCFSLLRNRWSEAVGATFSPPDWDRFRTAAHHDEDSTITDPNLTDDGACKLPPDSPALTARPTIGPTRP